MYLFNQNYDDMNKPYGKYSWDLQFLWDYEND